MAKLWISFSIWQSKKLILGRFMKIMQNSPTFFNFFKINFLGLHGKETHNKIWYFKSIYLFIEYTYINKMYHFVKIILKSLPKEIRLQLNLQILNLTTKPLIWQHCYGIAIINLEDKITSKMYGDICRVGN